MTTISGERPLAHPIVSFTTRAHEVLDRLTEAPAWSMTPAELRTVLVELARLEARVTELRLRTLAAADSADVGADSAATSTAAWVAHETRQVRSAARADVGLALLLDTTYALTRQAHGEGRLDAAQARAVVRAVEALPDDLPSSERHRAERHLVDEAGSHDARALEVLGRRVLEVVDPEGADLAEGRRLETEERAAARTTYLQLTDNHDGTHTGRFRFSTLHAAMLRKALQAILAPRRRHLEPDRDAETSGSTPDLRLSRPELMGRAFGRLLERFPAKDLPRSAGLSATVVVLMEHDTLLSDLGAAHLDTGEAVSAGVARRMACEAGIVPVVYRRVLGGPSVVLDVGRRRRFHDAYQRIALTVQDGGCSAEGCDRPPGWTEAHHDEMSWHEGGGTSVERGRLLCSFHHHRAHDPAFEATRLANGRVAFHRRE